MNASEFIKRRAKIDYQHDRPNWWKRRAMDRLVREARAVPVLATDSRKMIGWKLASGEMVCMKQRFKSQEVAMRTLGQIAACEPHRPHTPIRAYPCFSCGGWHITSKVKHEQETQQQTTRPGAVCTEERQAYAD